jgi:hypothetical protein
MELPIGRTSSLAARPGGGEDDNPLHRRGWAGA